MGRVIRAYRRHPWHGRNGLRQEEVAVWAGVNQSQLSRIENGPAIGHLDRLSFWATLLRIPQRYLWFELPAGDVRVLPLDAEPAAGPSRPNGGPVTWPVQVGRPPARPRAFQHREALADAIMSGLSGNGGAIPAQVVATGGGGAGKTQLAAAAFADARQAGMDLLVWVNASSRDSIVTSYAHARAATEPGVLAGSSSDEAAIAFLGWLGVTDHPWMIVLDSVVDPADVRGLWPEGRSGRVLATTRRRDLAPAGARQLAVGAFTPEEADAYLTERITGYPANPAHPDALDDAAEMADDLGYLPLALAQAAAVIVNEGITCAAYRRRFADRTATLERLFPSDASADDYAHTIATTWSLAIERADKLAPEGLARPALDIASVVDPHGVPDTLWATRAVLGYLDRGRSTRSSEPSAERARTTADDAHAALRNLHRLNLVTHEPGGGAQAVRTASLVQRTTLEPLSPADRAAVVRVAADGLVEIWPGADTDPDLVRVLRRNTTALANRAKDVLWTTTGHKLVFRTGQSLAEQGLHEDAIAYWTEATAVATRRLGPDHRQTFICRHTLADLRGVTGDAVGAARAFEDLLRDRGRVLGAEHPDTFATRNSLADWLGFAGDPAGAAASLEQLLDDALRVLGPDHRHTLTARHILADWLGLAGDAPGAFRAFQELHRERVRVLGHDHIETLATVQSMAVWQGAAGDTAGSLQAFEELVRDMIRVLGPDHPDTFAGRISVGWGRGLAGDPRGAVQILEEMVADSLAILGPDHVHTLTGRHSLANWRALAGDPAGAVRELEELFADRAPLLGPDHSQTLGVRIHLAWIEGLAAGDPVAAAGAFQKLLDDHVRIFGPDHPMSLAARNDLAYWRGAAGDPLGAAEEFEELVEHRTRVLGPDHPETLFAFHSMARWRAVAGDPVGAADAYEKLLEHRTRLLGPDHMDTLRTRHSLARCRGVIRGAAEAVTELQDLLDDVLATAGPEHVEALRIRHSLVYWRGSAGEMTAAGTLLAEVVEEAQRVLGPDHPHTAALVGHLERWPAIGAADELRREALEALARDRLPVPSAENLHTHSARIGLADWRLGGVRRGKTW